MTAPTTTGRDRADRTTRALAMLVLLLAVVVVWLTPHMTGDTFMALASGRDAAAGKVGVADDWAFTTHGIWINQNWGSGLLFYALYQAMGGAGLLLLKAVCVAGLGVLLAVAGRQRGAGTAVACLTSAAALAGSVAYIDLRPNLVGLAAIALLLVLLGRAEARPRRIWWTVPLLLVWANTHGSFLFGLGALGLWALCHDGFGRLRAGARGWPHATLAAAVAVVLAATATPFGLANLTHPFTSLTGKGSIWRDVEEWHSVFSSGFGRTGELFAAIGLFGGVLVARGRGAVTGSGRLFELVLCTVTVLMALRARRFVPTALLVMTPPVASGVATLLRDRRAWLAMLWMGLGVAAITLLPSALLQLPGAVVMVPTGLAVRPSGNGAATWPRHALTLALGTAMALALPRLRHHYAADNPLFARESLFQRMVWHAFFPDDAATFLSDNAIEGRAYNEWAWEGYLHWRYPPLELFAGGRAQQAYPPAIYRKWKNIFVHGVAPNRLPLLGGNLLIGSRAAEAVILKLFLWPGSPWVPIYHDGCAWILANANDAGTRDLVARARNGTLHYPTPAIAAISHAMLLCADQSRATFHDIEDAIVAATAARPLPALYQTPIELARLRRLPVTGLTTWFERESVRLGDLRWDRPRGIELLESRGTIAGYLAHLHDRAGNREPAATWQRQLEALSRAVSLLKADRDPGSIPLPPR